MKLWMLIFLLLMNSAVNAEVYRWTDSSGKVHYGDKKPAEKAEDISAKVKQQNIDTSSTEHQKLETIFRKENDADREYKRQQTQRPLVDIRKCQEMKRYLQVISGPVQFLDEDGKAIRVTEEERKKRVLETSDYIAKNCQE